MTLGGCVTAVVVGKKKEKKKRKIKIRVWDIFVILEIIIKEN